MTFSWLAACVASILYVASPASPSGPVPPVFRPPRVALLYSDYGNFRHRDDYDARLAALAWPMDKYENTHFADLVAHLDQYDFVLGSALYNYSHVQDFSHYRQALLAYLRRGGALVLTDVNYRAHVDWLRGLGEEYAVTLGKCDYSGKPAQPTLPDHPLLNWPHRWQLRASWTHMTTGPRWQVLARCPDGSVVWALAPVGRGFIWLSSFWPLSREQLEDLWEYIRARRAGVEILSVQGLTSLARGPCRARVAVRTLSAEESPVEIAWFARGPAGKLYAARRQMKIAGGKTARVLLELRLDRRGSYSTWLQISRLGQPSYLSCPARVTVPERYKAVLLRPAYRHSLYVALPRRELRVQLIPYPFDEDFTGARLQTVLAQQGKILVSHTCRAPHIQAKPWVLSLDLSSINLAPGKARLRMAVEQRGRRLWTTSWDLPVVEAHTPQVTLGPDLETYVNGQPFFPIGIYHVPREAYGRARAMGFNCLQAWGNTVQSAREALDAAQAQGLKVVLEMSGLLRGKYRPEDFRAVVRACRDHPALLAWYPVDEPSDAMYEACLDAYRICRQEDPHHPVYLVMCRPGAFAHFASTTDILAVDPYPIPHAPVGTVAGWARRAGEAMAGRGPFWLIPQLQNLAAYRGDPSKGRGPTAQEEWCMVFQGLIYGAKGLVYYPWDDGKCGLVHEPQLMQELPRINSFLASWGLALAAGRRSLIAGLGMPAAEDKSPDLHAALFFTREQGCLLLATNTAKTALKLQVKFAEHGEVRAVVKSLLDDRKWESRGGVVEMPIRPLEVLAARIIRK